MTVSLACSDFAISLRRRRRRWWRPLRISRHTYTHIIRTHAHSYVEDEKILELMTWIASGRRRRQRRRRRRRRWRVNGRAIDYVTLSHDKCVRRCSRLVCSIKSLRIKSIRIKSMSNCCSAITSVWKESAPRPASCLCCSNRKRVCVCVCVCVTPTTEGNKRTLLARNGAVVLLQVRHTHTHTHTPVSYTHLTLPTSDLV